MNLPKQLSDKINEVFLELDKNSLKQTQKNLTDKYKNHTGKSTDLIAGKNDSILYAVSRMPATFAVISSLIYELANEGHLLDIKSVTDIGSGTGSAFFALNELCDGELEFSLYEKNNSMIEIFKKLTGGNVPVNKCDVCREDIKNQSDLVMTSFVLSEMLEGDRVKVFEKMLNLSKKYVLVIDTGTPETYKNTINLKPIAEKLGFKLVAPCKCDKCPLENDYCQFYARVERSAILRQAKSATLSYEDEKYFYLLFERNSIENKLGNDIENGIENKFENDIKKVDFEKLNFKKIDFEGNKISKETNEIGRVIRRPKIKEKEVELVLCTAGGVVTQKITKANKPLFKVARKIKINEVLAEERTDD